MIRRTDYYRDVDYKRIEDSRKNLTFRNDDEKFFPIDIVELVLLKIGVIDKFEDFSSIKSKEVLYSNMSSEYEMREKFLELYDDLFRQVLKEFESMINIRSGGTVISNKKERRSDDSDINVKIITGYDHNNLLNLAYRSGFDSEYYEFSNLRVRSDIKKDLDYKDFLKERINLYYIKHDIINL